MSKQTAVAIFAGESGVSKDNFIETLVEHRKNGTYLYNPISMEITEKGIVDNFSAISKGIDLMEARAVEAIKNELDVDNLVLLKKENMEIYEWMKASRLSITKVLDEFKSKGTANEKRIKDGIIGDIDNQILKMNEKQFVVAEKNIKKNLEALIEENKDLGIGLDLFDSFIEVKRKTSGMLPSESTGKTSANALRTISDEFEKIAKPVREAQELEKKKALQSKNFEHYLDGIDVDGDNIEAGIKALYQLEASVDNNFPDIIEACKRSIKNKIEKAESNIKAKQLMKERDEANKKLNASKEHDAPYMERVTTISHGVMLEDEKTLQNKLDRLREIHPSLKDDENKKKVLGIANSIKDLIAEMQVKDIKQNVKPVETVKQYGITDDAINEIIFELQMVEVDAEDEVDARGKIIAIFAELFKTEYIKGY